MSRNVRRDHMPGARDRFRLGMGVRNEEKLGLRVRGDVFIELRDGASGAMLDERHLTNLITLDASILAGILFRDPSSRTNGINMLAVGTGAPGPILSPDAPDNRERHLFAELARKPFSSTTFRDGSGNAVAYPTNVVDFTASFAEAEAVGPLNEMSLLSTISSNPSIVNPVPNVFPARTLTLDLSTFDISVNVLNFSVVSKPSTAVLTVTWRLSF